MIVTQSAPPNFEQRLKRYLSDVQRQNSEAGKAFLYLEFVRDVFRQIDMDYLERLYPDLERYMKFKSKTLVVKGKSDAFLSNVIVEFKVELTKSAREEAEAELRRYVAIIWSKQGKTRVAYVTVATDGIDSIVYRPRTSVSLGEEVSPDAVSLDIIDRLALNKASPGRVFIWLDRYMLYRTLKAATAEGISDEFGLGKSAYNDTLPLIQQAWEKTKESALYEQWASYLRIVYGTKVESEELFLRHAYLATLAKLMAYATMSGGALPISEEEIVRILVGDKFSQEWGIWNFVEEDFFTWVARDPNGIRATQNLLERISSYDLTKIDEDILKGLYQGLVDAEERHDLGEYYTPDWLAEYVVLKTLAHNTSGSVLDPACGSGTFLAAAIRAKKNSLAEKMTGRKLLEHIIATVAGIDIHPLAVLMARTSYLLSIGTELLNLRAGELVVPVYMADSIRLPEEKQADLRGIECLTVNADGVQLRVPTVMTKDPALADPAIETAKQYAKLILKGETPEEQTIFNELVRRSEALRKLLLQSKEGKSLAGVVLALAQDMANLIKAKKDTIWGFILKNKYKPLFLRDRKVEFLIGNPPWLSYRFVESADYQEFLKHAILTEHALLAKSDAELITQMELGTLFFVRCASLYLKQGGRIGFVLPRSIFTAGQHDNFRRLKFVPLLAISQIIDLYDVRPIFKMPACVVIAHKRK